MRLLVCGGRDFADADWLAEVLAELHWRETITLLIHGASRGADMLADAWGRDNKILIRPFPAKWDDLSHPDAVIKTRRDGTKYDAKAGHRRNQQMLDEGRPHLVVAFPGGTGTDDMMRRANAANVGMRRMLRREREPEKVKPNS